MEMNNTRALRSQSQNVGASQLGKYAFTSAFERVLEPASQLQKPEMSAQYPGQGLGGISSQAQGQQMGCYAAPDDGRELSQAAHMHRQVDQYQPFHNNRTVLQNDFEFKKQNQFINEPNLNYQYQDFSINNPHSFFNHSQQPQPYGPPQHFVPGHEADHLVHLGLKQNLGLNLQPQRPHSSFGQHQYHGTCQGENAFFFEDPRSTHREQQKSAHFAGQQRLGAQKYSEESSRSEGSVGREAARKVTGARSTRRQAALAGDRAQGEELDLVQQQKKDLPMGEPALPGNAPRIGKNTSQQRVLKGAVTKINRKLRRKTVPQKKCSDEGSMKQTQNCQGRKSKTGVRQLTGPRGKNTSTMSSYHPQVPQLGRQNEQGAADVERFYEEDEEEGSTINLRGVLFDTRQNQRRPQRQIQKQVNPGNQHHGPSQERQTTICNIQNCYVQIQLSQFDGQRGDVVPNLFHQQQQQQQAPEYYPQMHGPHQNPGGQHSMLQPYPHQYNMPNACANQQNPFGGAGNYQNGHHLMYPMSGANANQVAYKGAVTEPAMPHDFLRFPPACRNDGSQVMQERESPEALSEEDELSSPGQRAASEQQQTASGLLQRPPCSNCGIKNQPCCSSSIDCAYALQNTKCQRHHVGPQQRQPEDEDVAQAALKQQYDHYPAMNFLPNEEMPKDKSDSNKILQSVENDHQVATNNSRLQSQSSLINKKDRDSLNKRNDRQASNRYPTSSACLGFNNLNNDKNCCKPQNDSNQSNANNACCLRKHMHNLSNLAEQHCADPDQEDSIKQLRSEFRYGKTRRDSERLDQKHHYDHSQVGEAVHDPPLSMMFGVNDQLPRELHQHGSCLHIDRKLHSVKSQEEADKREHMDEESMGLDGHHNESHYPLMKNQFVARPEKAEQMQRRANQRFEIENHCEPSLFLKEQQEEIQNSNDSHSSKQIKKFFDVARPAKPDDPLQATAQRPAATEAAQAKDHVLNNSKAEEVVWPAGNQVPEHNLEQIADSDIDIVSRNLPKVHNISQGRKAPLEGQPKDARGDQESMPLDLRMVDGGAVCDHAQDRKCLQLHHQFKAPRQKLPRIQNEKRLRMQIRTVPFQKKRDQKVKDKAKKTLKRQGSRTNSDQANPSAKNPNCSGSRPQLFDHDSFPNQFFDPQGGRRPADASQNQQPPQYQVPYDQAAPVDHHVGVAMNYQGNYERQAIGASPDHALPMTQSQVDDLLGEQPEPLCDDLGALQQQQRLSAYPDDRAAGAPRPLQEDHLPQSCALDAHQNNNCPSKPRLEANFQDNQRTIKSEQSKLATFSQPLEIVSQKDRLSMQHNHCPKCKCGTVTSQPTVIPKNEQLEMDANLKEEFRSQKKTLVVGNLSQRSRSVSKKSNSAKLLKKRKLGPPYKKSEENYMFPASKKKNNRTVSYFNWKEQILKQNKIISLNHISEPHPGCSAEIDEQKYRFIYELQMMQEERKRFESELDHYYAYQKKWMSPSPQRTSGKGCQENRSSGQADNSQQAQGKSPYSDMRNEQIDQHLMCVQWSLKKIGKLSLQERFEKIQNYRKRRDCREWDKKISYDCRKVVADNRIRVKGRFIKKEDQNKMQQVLEEAEVEAEYDGDQAEAGQIQAGRKPAGLQASKMANIQGRHREIQNQGSKKKFSKVFNNMSQSPDSKDGAQDSNKGPSSQKIESQNDKQDDLRVSHEPTLIKQGKIKWKKSQAAARPEQEARTPSPDKTESPFNPQPAKKKIRKRDRRQKKAKQEAVSQAAPPQQVSSTASVSATVQKRQKKDTTAKVESWPEEGTRGKVQQN